MKKTVTREVDCCDECGAEVSYTISCMKCGAVYCYDHRERFMVSFPHSVYCYGSGDGSKDIVPSSLGAMGGVGVEE